MTHKCAVPPENLRSTLSFARTFNIPNLILCINWLAFYRLETLHWLTPAWLRNCVLSETKQTFAQGRIFLVGTLLALSLSTGQQPADTSGGELF